MLPGQTYRFEDLLSIAWRGKWTAVAMFAVITAATLAVTARMPNRYKSETLILVVPQRVPESYVRSTVTTRIEDRLQSLQQEILSRSRLERVIRHLDLYAEERRTGLMEDIVERMRTAITVQTVRGDAFRVSYIADDPRVAQSVTERLASLFIEENVREREVLAQGASEFLQSQLDSARKQLIEQEKKLEAYRLQHAGELPSQSASNVGAVQTIRMQLQTLAESINRDRDRHFLLERQLGELTSASAGAAVLPATGADAAGRAEAAPLDVQLAEAANLLAAQEARYKADHPDVIRQKRIVARLEKALEAERAAPAGGAGSAGTPQRDSRADRRAQAVRAEMEFLARQLSAKQVEEARLRDEMALYQARLEAAPIRESELTELTRDYETLQELYRGLLAKREDSKVAANLERRQVGEQFRVLDPARVPERPYSPNRLQLNLMGAAFGLVLGLGMLAVREYRDSSFKTEDEIRSRLSLLVIASIPDVTPRRSWRALWRRAA